MNKNLTHQFSRVPNTNISRSSFDRSHNLKTTFDSGKLVPIFCDEVLPGDTFNLKMHAFARLATPIHPIMDNMFLETFFFFVPNRLTWSNWKKFMGEQTDPDSSTDYTVPSLEFSNTPESTSIADYLGLPVGVSGYETNVLPIRAYGLIWNEWFRDQNLQDSIEIATDDTGNVGIPSWGSSGSCLPRGKRHDYFTSALPWPQKGDSINIGLSGNAPVYGIGVLETEIANNSPATVRESYGTTDSYTTSFDSQNDKIYFNGSYDISEEPRGTLSIHADLSDATAITINQLRQAFQLQHLLEIDAKSGTRYVEIIKAHFGIYNAGGDARLQRPEYLGGGSTPVNVTPIAQTSGTDTTPQGNLAAMGTVSVNGDHGFTKSFTEHGYIIGLVNVRADLTYQQGLNRMWSRETRYDFYWPALSQLGEQTILNKEIFVSGNQTVDQRVFGYQERYAEYRYKPSFLTGLMRSNVSTGNQTLDSWHLSQDFDSTPSLNADFIEDNPPLDRAIAIPSEPQFIMDTYFNLKCSRPMPLYGVPASLGRF